jgi:transcriptional regulator with XRE-family HTH domain
MNETASSGAATAVEAVSSGRLGERVRELRRRRGLTLEELAELSGVSRAMISKLERGEKNPTLVVAARLADGLGVTLSRLAGMEEQHEVIVVPKEKRMVMSDPETGFERQLLSPNTAGLGVEFIKNTIPKGSTSGEFPPHRKGVEEQLVVEQGTLKATLAGDEYLLEEGDALYFEADVPHRFDNAGEGKCSYYLVFSTRQS